MGHLTIITPLLGGRVIHLIIHDIAYLCIKFDNSSFSHSWDMNGVPSPNNLKWVTWRNHCAAISCRFRTIGHAEIVVGWCASCPATYLLKVAYFNLPDLYIWRPRCIGMTPFEFCGDLWQQKPQVPGYRDVALFAYPRFSQAWLTHTDEQTDARRGIKWRIVS